MRIQRVFYLSLAFVLLAGVLPLAATAQPAPAPQGATLEPELLTKLQAEGNANFFVKLSVEADLSPAYAMDWDARGEYVWTALNAVARTTQAPVLDYCVQNGLDCTSNLTTNSVFVRAGNLATAQSLAILPGVAYLRLERILQLPDPVVGGAGINRVQTSQDAQTSGASPEYTKEWGLVDAKADQVWALGFKGSGIKVANIDTGVQWNHPALDQAFACGSNPSDPKCWSDPENWCGGSACDNNGHGTHTMGTMIGDDDPGLTYWVGMAPDAKWIACKGCGSSSCSDFALTSCADWILAPAGNAANRPNVVNNSWGGGGADSWYLSYVQAWRASGIFPAFSAGNSGSGCNTLGSPGDYQESLASAAHDSSRTIAYFSSRGPSYFGHEPYTKPNVSAPGVNICSSVPTNGWDCGYSGTSMASPHTAGAVALIWQACPALKGDIDATFRLLQNNADTPPGGNCGAPGDGGNYTYGYGYLNALRAVQACSGGGAGTLAGYVKDQDDVPIVGATVTASNGSSDATDSSGYYQIPDLPAGTYTATAAYPNYFSSTATVVITGGQTTNQSFKLFWLGAWVNYGTPCFDWTRYDAEYYPATGKAYILGGRGGASGGDTFGDIYSFNPATGACADTGANMPTPISNYTIATLSFSGVDWLCTFGGRDSSGAMTLAVQCYNPNTNGVTTKADLPGAFSGFLPGGVSVVSNKAYIFGGFRSTSAPYDLGVTYEYNPGTNAYTSKGNLTLARAYMFTAVADGKIYAFGGTTYDGANLIAQIKSERFDPAAGTWSDSDVPDLPIASGEGRAFGFDTAAPYGLSGRIILAGGGQWPAVSAEVLTYFLGGKTYGYGFPDLNVARRDMAGFFQAGNTPRLWVLGGRAGADTPPYAPAEYLSVLKVSHRIYLPAMLRGVTR